MELNLNNPIAERANKTVFRDNDKSIKLFIENYSKANILNEALNQARVEEGCDLNIPKLIAVTKVDNRWALVSEYVEGKTLETMMNEQPERMDEFMDMFINIQLEVLSKNVPMLNRIKDKFKRKLSETDILDDNKKYELMQRLDSMPSHTRLCHGDFNPSNIIIRDSGEHYIIDWAHVTQGNSSADAARTFLIFSLEGKEELAEKYLNMFSEKSGIDKREIQRWIPIVAATQMTKGNEHEKELLSRWTDVVEYM